jgi:hypothetical protein
VIPAHPCVRLAFSLGALPGRLSSRARRLEGSDMVGLSIGVPLLILLVLIIVVVVVLFMRRRP